MIVLKSQVEAIASRKDNTLKLVLGTQELSPSDCGQMFGLMNKLCTVGISANDLEKEDIETLQNAKLNIDDVPNGKSPSQRLRSVLFVYWQQHKTGFEDFNAFYTDYIEKKINQIKSKLEQ